MDPGGIIVWIWPIEGLNGSVSEHKPLLKINANSSGKSFVLTPISVVVRQRFFVEGKKMSYLPNYLSAQTFDK